MRIAVLTVSDKAAAGEREDRSGELVAELVPELCAGTVVARRVVPDDRTAIASAIEQLSRDADVVLTTGGTGIGPRDVTPEATRDVIEKEMPGFAEIMRVRGYDSTPRAVLSRGTAGTVGTAVVVNFPGSPRAVRECLPLVAPVFAHAIEVLRAESVECGGD